MSQQAWVDPRVGQVHPGQVRSYLLARGWHLQPYPGPELWVFGGPVDDAGEAVIQILPTSEKMRDYRMRLEELIASLAVMEDRPAVEVLADVLRCPADVVLPANVVNGSGALPAPK